MVKTLRTGLSLLPDEDEVFGSREDVSVCSSIARARFGDLQRRARDVQVPPQPKGSVAVAGAARQGKLRLEPVAPRRNRNRNAEVSRTRVEAGPKFFPDTLQGTSPLGAR